MVCLKSPDSTAGRSLIMVGQPHYHDVFHLPLVMRRCDQQCHRDVRHPRSQG
jgi:hypothetical protein